MEDFLESVQIGFHFVMACIAGVLFGAVAWQLGFEDQVVWAALAGFFAYGVLLLLWRLARPRRGC
jgi:hypothetical protein